MLGYGAQHLSICMTVGEWCLRKKQENSMYYVYVLYSIKDNNFYIGYTADINKRFKEHIAGKTPSTHYRRPFDLIYYEAHISKNDALRRESYFKNTKGRTTLRQILRDSLLHYKQDR